MHTRIYPWLVVAFVAAHLLSGCGEKAALGAKCKRDNDCGTGTCLAVVDGQVCTKECTSDTDCGGALSCYEAGSYGYCGPADTKGKAVGAACSNASECDHRICVKSLMNVSQGTCSKLCKADAECGTGSKCGKGITGSLTFCQVQK